MREPEPPSFTDDYKEVNVHVDGLHTFASAVDKQNEENFTPHVYRLSNDYAAGVPFALWSPSGDMVAAKQKYYDCLTATTERLMAYINVSQTLTDAIRQV